MYTFAAYLLKILLSLFGRLKVEEKDKLPQSGGFVLACTHTGWIEILWLGISILPLKINYMAKKELFDTRFLKWLMHKLNAFPVDRENPGPSTLKIPRRLLNKGEIVGIFPSGTRTTEEVPLKKGAVTIAAGSNVPIVPAVYIGPANLKDLFQRKKAGILFGDAILPDHTLPKKEQAEFMMEKLNEEFEFLHSELLKRLEKGK
ncbi:lysophospholipid acyltransferase family protein [Heyndrickxia acidicola]|uniref:lysophospholipid acyltransferase family protein n=1 Tax=Heyndrickxia acidicola TaxID=209389 RepID=UPI00399D3757